MPKTTLAIVVLSTLLAFAGATAGYLWFQGQVLARSSSAAFGQAIVQTQDGLDEAGGVIQHVQTLIMAAATALPKGVRDGGDPHALLDVRRIQKAADAGDRFQSALPARPR